MQISTKYLTHVWHYTTVNAWTSILASGFLKSRRLLISETIQARKDWQAMKQNREALVQALPPYMKGRHSPLRRKGMIFFSRHPYFEKQAGLLTEVKTPNLPWSRREDEQEEITVLGMRDLFERGGGLVRLGMLYQTPHTLLPWPRLINDAGVGWFERLEMGCIDKSNDCYNANYVLGIVADAIPLSAISCVEIGVPSPDGGTCAWIPFLFPLGSMVDVDQANRIMLEMKATAIAHMKSLVERGKIVSIELANMWLPAGDVFLKANQPETVMVPGFAM
jgi:hypothetical protein